MRKIVLFTFMFSQTVFAQHQKEKVHEVPVASQVQPYEFPEDQLLNTTLKGSKWYFNLKSYQEDVLYLDKNRDKMKSDVLYFVDGNHFQITINQQSCKTVIKGTYQIMKTNDGTNVILGKYRPFTITSRYQKCVGELSGFLSGALDISFDEDGQKMEIKQGEDFVPATGHGN
ncbi:hypothetical protein [Chryseobacterium gregarium]|uniref:hypothetical protein n=1 Tax=Chryseobacterium gregarium TaxID=456299 RepID=UPI0004079275|nr:hypothetical protein [Chryseobacterium gregarium]